MIAKGKKIVAFAMVLCMLLCLLPGCGEEKIGKAYALPETFENVPSQVIAENNAYRLDWDSNYSSIMMHSKLDGKVWGTTPYEFYQTGDTNNNASSPIVIEAVEKTTLANNVARAYTGCITNGHVSSKLIENGIEVTYYFDDYRVSVPVRYTLRADSLAVSVDSANIAEGDQFMLKSVSLAPFMCSVPNVGEHAEEEEDDDLGLDLDIDLGLDLDIDLGLDLGTDTGIATVDLEDEETAPVDTETDADAEEGAGGEEEKPTTAEILKNSYLFVPAGNGALMSSEVKDGDPREYKGEMYGTDAGRYQPYEYYAKESVKMPVFGVKNGVNALLGIMEQGAEQGLVQASCGNDRALYSNVGATFFVRGFDVYAEAMGNNSTVSTRLSKTMVDNTFIVGFYPLSGEDADYVGMAKRYRRYLEENGMVKTDVKQNVYALSVLGNVMTKSLAFGVPYESVKSMTTFKEAEAIIKEMVEVTNLTPSVQLLGYGSTGLDIGKVAGGFKFAGTSGSKKDYNALTAFATDKNVPLFTDFDLVYFKQGGNGFSKMMNAAKTATLHRSEVYYRMLALRAQDKDKGFYHILNRSQLAKAMDKLLNKGDKLGVSGYSFATLGSAAYSDYDDEAYYTKKNMASDVKALFDKVSKAGHKLSSNNANDYAAMLSDTMFGVELDPRNTDGIEEYVPFYQIVFKGYTPMYSEALNLSSDYETLVLRALESGVGLGYNVTMNYDVSFAASAHEDMFNSLYSSIKDKITETATKYKDYYAAIADATITDYEVLDNGVSVTTFSNGVVAYTNKTDAAQTYPGGKLAAKGFKYVQGGTN